MVKRRRKPWTGNAEGTQEWGKLSLDRRNVRFSNRWDPGGGGSRAAVRPHRYPPPVLFINRVINAGIIKKLYIIKKGFPGTPDPVMDASITIFRRASPGKTSNAALRRIVPASGGGRRHLCRPSIRPGAPACITTAH